METKKNQNQVVITMNSEDEKQKLPLNLIIPMAAGTLAGTAITIGLFMLIKMLFGF